MVVRGARGCVFDDLAVDVDRAPALVPSSSCRAGTARQTGTPSGTCPGPGPQHRRCAW
jgi:hypothetical protein